jgi:hypothetical protein
LKELAQGDFLDLCENLLIFVSGAATSGVFGGEQALNWMVPQTGGTEFCQNQDNETQSKCSIGVNTSPHGAIVVCLNHSIVSVMV